MKFTSILSELRLYLCNHIVAHVPSHSIRLGFYKRIMNFKIGKGSTIFMNCKFDTAKQFIIGDNVVINSGCRLDNRGQINIGNNVSISQDVIILTADHDVDSDSLKGRQLRVEIHENAFVGTRAMILPGVKIEAGGVVAAGSLVNKDVGVNMVVGGVPARFLKLRNPDYNYKVSYRRLFQ
jgi:acetyltransferase-like isoleucine patch superfamily enzyme